MGTEQNWESRSLFKTTMSVEGSSRVCVCVGGGGVTIARIQALGAGSRNLRLTENGIKQMFYL
jgi:hypothetical protein